MASFLTGIREGIDLFSHDAAVDVDEVVRAAREVMQSKPAMADSLGYRKLPTAKGERPVPAAIKKELGEHGLQLTDAQFNQLLKLDEAEHARNMARRRFIMQVTLSLIIAGFTVGVLALGHPAPSMEKALFTLLGTVVGYWLR